MLQKISKSVVSYNKPLKERWKENKRLEGTKKFVRVRRRWRMKSEGKQYED